MILLVLHIALALNPSTGCATELFAIELEHSLAAEMAEVLQPLLDDGPCRARLAALPQPNLLLVRAVPAAQQRLMSVLRRLDRPAWRPSTGAPMELVVTRQVEPEPPGPGLGHAKRQIWHVRARANEEVRLPIEHLRVQVRSAEAPWAVQMRAVGRYLRVVWDFLRSEPWTFGARAFTCRAYWTVFRGTRVQFGDGACESLE